METTKGIGLGLSRRFYQVVVAPMLQHHFPELAYAAARIGLGSEVLGYDTALSADHDYGPCVQIFLADEAFASLAQRVLAVMDRELPATFEGWSVRYPTNIRPPADNVAAGMLGSDHGVELYTVAEWSTRFARPEYLSELTSVDWLSCSEQILLTVTAGAVFRDDTGELSKLRQRLAYLPADVWLYKLAAQWGRVAELRAHIGRAGSVGDELGSRIMAAETVSNLMRLALLIERRYAPYPKWFGSAFAALDCAAMLSPKLNDVLVATTWQDREASLLDATRYLAELQYEKRIPGAIIPTVASIHSRPYRFIDTIKIAEALQSVIQDEYLRQTPEFGGADQFISSQFVLAVPEFSRRVVTALLLESER